MMRKYMIAVGLVAWILLVWVMVLWILTNMHRYETQSDVLMLAQDVIETENTEHGDVLTTQWESEPAAEETRELEEAIKTAAIVEKTGPSFVTSEWVSAVTVTGYEEPKYPTVIWEANWTIDTNSIQEESEPLHEQPIEPTPSSFVPCESASAGGSIRRYWLYTPSAPKAGMPLIVYLHGGSGKGDDLNQITAVDGLPQYLQSGILGDVRAYVLIPQLPSDQKGWAGVHDSLYSLILSIVSEYSIDMGNISLTGHSMGGTGTWSFGAAYSTLFARIAPLSGSVRNAAGTALALRNTPVWAFVGSEDTIVPPETSLETVKQMAELGADARIMVLDGADHFTVPSRVYLDGTVNLIAWLIGENR